jgi:hypothetical protein
LIIIIIIIMCKKTIYIFQVLKIYDRRRNLPTAIYVRQPMTGIACYCWILINLHHPNIISRYHFTCLLCKSCAHYPRHDFISCKFHIVNVIFRWCNFITQN